VEEVLPGFRAFVARTFGDEGRDWLARLPALSSELALRWRLELGAELPGGVLSCVLAATRDGEPVVLKLTGGWDRPADEIRCLRRWAGDGAPRLLDADPALGALLLDRVVPGAPATAARAREVGELLGLLHVDPLAELPRLEEVARRRLARAVAQGRQSADRAARAAELLPVLVATTEREVLLHGDFDERNMLVCARRGLVAIDPLPCVGDPAYDAASWAHANGRTGRRERQHAIATALGLDPERVRRWGVVVATHG
jgi:streptomycin 6-kinase